VEKPKSGGEYPARWRIKVRPETSNSLSASRCCQELVTEGSTRITYWEGRCTVRKARQRGDVRGVR